MKQIAVGSRNPVKIEAVRLAFTKIWPDDVWEAVGYKTQSGVSAQPMSAAESQTGAKNRAIAALKQNADAWYGVGIEGGLEQIGDNWYDCGWCVVVDRDGFEGIASSARIPTPESIMKHIRNGAELGDAIDNIFNRKNTKQAEGHFGLMTNNAVTRTSGYVQGVCLALSRFLHPKLFE